jgi:hypothetical protein
MPLSSNGPSCPPHAPEEGATEAEATEEGATEVEAMEGGATEAEATEEGATVEALAPDAHTHSPPHERGRMPSRAAGASGHIRIS